MLNDSSRQIFEVFAKENLDCFLVGGAVRNYYLNSKVSDLDFAVECPPDKTIEVLEKHGVSYAPTGLSHGTLTAIIDGVGYEITSFRKDIKNDGRRAVTEYGGTLLEDAQRRDFTINALYMDCDMNLIDPLKVKSDLDNCILRFVGNSENRVKEDYLRILRFFRFLAQYDLEPDDDAIKACEQYQKGLENISAERIGAEMRKVLAGPFALIALQIADETDILPKVLPDFDDDVYGKWQVYLFRNHLPRDWRVELVMASGFIPRDEWRLSNQETAAIKDFREIIENQKPPMRLGEEYGEEMGLWGAHFRAFFHDRDLQADEIMDVKKGAKLEFPLNGQDMKSLGYQGKEIGKALSDAKEKWRASSYELDKDDLLEFIAPK